MIMKITVELNEHDVTRVQQLVESDMFNPGDLPKMTVREVVDMAVRRGLCGMLETEQQLKGKL